MSQASAAPAVRCAIPNLIGEGENGAARLSQAYRFKSPVFGASEKQRSSVNRGNGGNSLDVQKCAHIFARINSFPLDTPREGTLVGLFVCRRLLGSEEASPHLPSFIRLLYGLEKEKGRPMPSEPTTKKAVAFFDGQNLFHCAKAAFGYTFPNYDPLALARVVCADAGWECSGVRFYTGVPDVTDNPFWNHFWTAKGAQMGRQGVYVYTRSLRYRNKVVKLPDGSTFSFLDGDEKGIDVRIALDVISLAHKKAYDVALLFCRDQDLSEVADEIRVIAQEQRRWLKIASAFPYSPAVRKVAGIDKTDWIKIDRATYDRALDRRDYRPKRPATT